MQWWRQLFFGGLFSPSPLSVQLMVYAEPCEHYFEFHDHLLAETKRTFLPASDRLRQAASCGSRDVTPIFENNYGDQSYVWKLAGKNPLFPSE